LERAESILDRTFRQKDALMIAPTLRFAVAPAGTLRIGVNHDNSELAPRS
jgi:hypothetical protein